MVGVACIIVTFNSGRSKSSIVFYDDVWLS